MGVMPDQFDGQSANMSGKQLMIYTTTLADTGSALIEDNMTFGMSNSISKLSAIKPSSHHLELHR
jgi:hypothetical protein